MLNTAVPENRIHTAMPAAFGVATRILEAWGFSRQEMAAVLGLERRTFYRYLGDGLPARSVSRDLVERVSYILGIEKALEILLGGDDEADSIRQWIDSPSDAPLFAGQAPRQRLLGGRVADLFRVRQYLDGWRGGDFG